MVDFVFRRRILRIREMAFASINSIAKNNCDVIYLHSADETSLTNARNVYAKKQYTLVNDLNKTEEEILDGIKKTCKYEIRRADKEGAYISVYTNEENADFVLPEFENVYNNMFKAKGLSLSFNRSLVEAGIRAGQLIITQCRIDEYPGESVFHAYLADGTSCVLMYSASPLWEEGDKAKANCIGRMNKYLHYEDMLYFKANGYSVYEWGGISSPDNLGGIDRFKAEFGGEVKCFVNYFIANTLIGSIYVYLVKVRDKR